jgi:hypothetical protein
VRLRQQHMPAVVFPDSTRLASELALHRARETPGGGTAGRRLENCAESFASCHVRGGRRHRCGGSAGARPRTSGGRGPVIQNYPCALREKRFHSARRP